MASILRKVASTFSSKLNTTINQCYQILEVLSRNNPPPSLAVLGLPSHSPVSAKRNDSKSILDSIFDSLLLAVPKHRRSVEKRTDRRHKFTNFMEAAQIKKTIVPCLECGNFKEKGHLCKHCYSKVQLETKEMQSKMGEDLKFNIPTQEVEFLYEGEKTESNNKFVVQMDKSRPSWFPKNLLNKTGS